MGSPHSPKHQPYWTLTIRLFSFILRILVGVGSYPFAQMRPVYSTASADLVVRYKVMQYNSNNLHTVIWVWVFRSNTHDLQTIICFKKLEGNYTRILRAILNKSRWQHPTRHQLFGHLPPITKTIQARRTRHAGHCWRSRN